MMVSLQPSWTAPAPSIELVVDYRCPFADRVQNRLMGFASNHPFAVTLFNLNLTLCESVEELVTDPRHTAALRATRASVAVSLYNTARFTEFHCGLFEIFHSRGRSLYRSQTITSAAAEIADLDLDALTPAEWDEVDSIISQEHQRLTDLAVTSVPTMIRGREALPYIRTSESDQTFERELFRVVSQSATFDVNHDDRSE
jgi:hypothetical protein